MNKKKIINDPIYGFIHIQHEIVYDCISHPYFQRLRRIKQLGLTHLVYPGAQHTRFQHALGALHLMQLAIENLRYKGVEINEDEEKGALLAILLHDIGHGPFSHGLEHTLLHGVDHERISLQLMHLLNQTFNGQLDLAIRIFKNDYPRAFLHQLVSGQLDMDRLDYLRRDSFYTGVSEGTIGLDRIIQMLNVHEDELVVDEKGIFSIEKFLMARRFMYWQVYLHKTSLAADQLLLNILKRAKLIMESGQMLFASPSLTYFLANRVDAQQMDDTQTIERFCRLDDSDVMNAIKVWQDANDPILSRLCSMLVNRTLPRIQLSSKPMEKHVLEQHIGQQMEQWGYSREECAYFVYSGILENRTYSPHSDQIRILYKDGKLGDIAQASDTYTFLEREKPTRKYFISYPK